MEAEGVGIAVVAAVLEVEVVGMLVEVKGLVKVEVYVVVPVWVAG